MNISVLLLRPSKPECGTVASFQFGGVKRRKGLGVTVPTERWDKNRQRIKVLGSLHRDERTRLMGLNKRIEHHVKAIQDAVHTLTYELERQPTWEELSAALDRLQEGKENINETTLTFYQWVEEFITESEERLDDQSEESGDWDTSTQDAPSPFGSGSVASTPTRLEASPRKSTGDIGEPPPGLSATQRQAWRREQRSVRSHCIQYTDLLFPLRFDSTFSTNASPLHRWRYSICFCTGQPPPSHAYVSCRCCCFANGGCPGRSVNSLRKPHRPRCLISHQLMLLGNELLV